MFGNPSAPPIASPSSQTPDILGIWRLGDPLDGTRRDADSGLFLAQPADAVGSPRWDYVLKTVAAELVFAPDEPTLHSRRLEATRQLSATASASEVVHPNLIAILDASLSGHTPFVVMPRLVGLSLEQRCATMDQLALPVALWWTRQIAQALAALHAKGWIHGDVQPANVLVDDRGHATLVDLGYATRIHAPMHRLFRGTPQYASPELLAGNTAALPAMDVFALGRVLWQLLTQIQPANGGTLEPVAELIESMLASTPDDRPAASQVVQRLLNLEIDALGGHLVPQSHRRLAA